MSHIRFVRLLSASLLAWALCASFALAQSKASTDPDAVFNVQSKIYHRASCNSARRCTKNCIVVKLSEAKKRGGRPCQLCGGPPVQQSSAPHDVAPGVAAERGDRVVGVTVKAHSIPVAFVGATALREEGRSCMG